MRAIVIAVVSGFLILAGAPAPAAEGSSIVIKGEDGTVSEYVIPESARGRPVILKRPGAGQRKEAQKPEMSAPREDGPVPAAAQEKAQEPAEEKRAAREASPEPEKPTGKAVKEAKGLRVPIPGRKPLLPQKLMAAVEGLAEEEAISRNLAISIAIEHAPPSKDFRVLKRIHNGIPVYAVVFRTESDPHVVLVDARNGDVVGD